MAAGFQYTAATINQQAAAAVIGVRNALAYAVQEYQWLMGLGAAGIEAAPAIQGGTQINAADAGNTLAALSDLAGLAQIFNGQQCTLGYGAAVATGPPYSFMTFGKFLTGGQ